MGSLNKCLSNDSIHFLVCESARTGKPVKELMDLVLDSYKNKEVCTIPDIKMKDSETLLDLDFDEDTYNILIELASEKNVDTNTLVCQIIANEVNRIENIKK